MKGPADYNTDIKRKIHGHYNSAVPTGALMNETEYLSKQSPSSNFYKPNFEAQAKSKRVPRADLNRDKSPKSPCVPLKKDDSPSPHTYKEVDKNWKKLATYPTSNFNYSISKSPKRSFIEESQIAKKKIPQVGHYDSGMDKFLKLSRGSIPHYKKGR